MLTTFKELKVAGTMGSLIECADRYDLGPNKWRTITFAMQDGSENTIHSGNYIFVDNNTIVRTYVYVPGDELVYTVEMPLQKELETSP